MNIQKAIELALAIDGYIARRNRTLDCYKIQPTVATDGCILIDTKNGESRMRWQPHAYELMADNWAVISNNNCLIIENADYENIE